MSYQCPPHIIKSTLSATIATAIASLGNVAFATTPDIPYDISKATELSHSGFFQSNRRKQSMVWRNQQHEPQWQYSA